MVGNVETNPGPQGPSSSSSQNVILDITISLCNLNIRSVRNKIDFKILTIKNYSDFYPTVNR